MASLKKEFRQFTDAPYPRIPDVRPLYNIPNVVASEKGHMGRGREVRWMHSMRSATLQPAQWEEQECLSRKSASRFDF